MHPGKPRGRVVRILLVATLLVAQCLFVGAGDVRFIRGDANSSGDVDLSDGVKILNVLFLGDRKLDCDDAMDVNDEGVVDISDGVSLLSYLFNGGPAPPLPFPGCGQDLTADSLTCVRYDVCGSCLGPADVQEELATAGLCIAAGAAPTVVGPATVTVVPPDLAQPCGPSGAPGWPLGLTVGAGSVDLPGHIFRFHASGSIEDMPVVVQAFFSTVCTAQVAFEGDLALHFTAENRSGALVLEAFDSLEIVNATLTLSAAGGTLCDAGAAASGFVEDMVLELLEAFIAQQLPGLNSELAGRVICAGA